MSEGKTPQRERIDELLAGWPQTERSALEWDEAAGGVMAKLEAGSSSEGVSDEDLLGPPLPATGDEVSGSAPSGKGQASMSTAATSSRQRDRANLKELAKMADMPPSSQPISGMFAEARRASQPPAEEVGEKKENSGLIHLGGLAEGEAKQAPAAAAAPAVATAKAAVVTGSKARSNANLRWLGGMVAAAAVAAGVFVGMRGQGGDTTTPPVAVMAPPPGPAATNPAAAPVVAPIAATDKGIDPSTLPPADLANAGSALPSSPKPQVVAAGSGPASPVAAAPTAAASAATPDPKLAAVVPSSAPASSGADMTLQQQMQAAAGVTPSTTSTATAATPDSPLAGPPGSVPFKPSMGAINGALGAAMPGARACLGPDDPISRATVTFQSDGSVQSVSVSGGAAGKPAEACIRAALMRARVQPFAVPTFSAPTTIRPN